MTDQAEDKLTRAHVTISGRVQGVGFRWNTLDMAQKLELTGWVRNLWDGRVEAVFEGPADKVQQAVDWCRHGRRPAQVDNLTVTSETPTGEYKYFRVVS